MDSDQGLEEQRALSKDLAQDVAIEAGIWIVAPEVKAAKLLLKAGKVLKLGKQISRGGKVLIPIAESKVGQEATKLIEKAGGRVVEKGIKTQWGWTGTKVWKNLVNKVGRGGTIERLSGKILTKSEAMKLIEEEEETYKE